MDTDAFAAASLAMDADVSDDILNMPSGNRKSEKVAGAGASSSSSKLEFDIESIGLGKPVPFIICKCPINPAPYTKRSSNFGGPDAWALACSNYNANAQIKGCGWVQYQNAKKMVDALNSSKHKRDEVEKHPAEARFYFRPTDLFFPRLNHGSPLVHGSQKTIPPLLTALIEQEEVVSFKSDIGEDSSSPPPSKSTETSPSMFAIPPTDAERSAVIWLAKDTSCSLYVMEAPGTTCSSFDVKSREDQFALERAQLSKSPFPSYMEWNYPHVRNSTYVDLIHHYGSKTHSFKIIETWLPDGVVPIMLHDMAPEEYGWLFGAAEYVVIPTNLKPHISGNENHGSWVVVKRAALRRAIFSRQEELDSMELQLRRCNSKSIAAADLLCAERLKPVALQQSSTSKLEHHQHQLPPNNGLSGPQGENLECGLCSAHSEMIEPILFVLDEPLSLSSETTASANDIKVEPREEDEITLSSTFIKCNITNGVCSDLFLLSPIEKFVQWAYTNNLIAETPLPFE